MPLRRFRSSPRTRLVSSYAPPVEYRHMPGKELQDEPELCIIDGLHPTDRPSFESLTSFDSGTEEALYSSDFVPLYYVSSERLAMEVADAKLVASIAALQHAAFPTDPFESDEWYLARLRAAVATVSAAHLLAAPPRARAAPAIRRKPVPKYDESGHVLAAKAAASPEAALVALPPSPTPRAGRKRSNAVSLSLSDSEMHVLSADKPLELSSDEDALPPLYLAEHIDERCSRTKRLSVRFGRKRASSSAPPPLPELVAEQLEALAEDTPDTPTHATNAAAYATPKQRAGSRPPVQPRSWLRPVMLLTSPPSSLSSSSSDEERDVQQRVPLDEPTPRLHASFIQSLDSALKTPRPVAGLDGWDAVYAQLSPAPSPAAAGKGHRRTASGDSNTTESTAAGSDDCPSLLGGSSEGYDSDSSASTFASAASSSPVALSEMHGGEAGKEGRAPSMYRPEPRPRLVHKSSCHDLGAAAMRPTFGRTMSSN